jgi:microcystin degradation protein MlrC
MRIFTAALVTETNTFSPFPTGMEAFEACGISWGPEDYSAETMFTQSVLHVRRLGERDGHEVVLGLSAYADPAGPTRREAYEALRAELLRRIELEGPFDGVLLTLHGAMVAEANDDCEGDLLGAIRRLAGPDVFIGAMLDPHCHLSPAMVAAADALTIMREYPHTDGKDRLDELYRIFLAVKEGAARPVCALVDCHMVGVWPTTEPPIRALVDRIAARAADPRLMSIGFAHGFPWGDVADAGARVLVIADDAMEAAEATALDVARDIQACREDARLPMTSMEQAMAAIRAPGLTVLADVADNPGGGAPGDATFILQAIIEARIGNVGLAIFHDPESVQACALAGVGARLSLRLGGKLGSNSGLPVAVDVTVRGYGDNHSQTAAGGAGIPLGPTAWVEFDGIHVIVSESRSQALSTDLFLGLGLDPTRLDAVVLKSTHHFRASFEPIASRIAFVGAPGALTPDLASIEYTKRPGPYWPRCNDIRPPTVVFRKGRVAGRAEQ